MKHALPIAVLIVVMAGGAWWLSSNTAPGATGEVATATKGAAEVGDGKYEVVASESSVSWAGQKPLIEGYINTGSIAVSEGTITREGDSVSGTFVMDMRTLSVSATPTKPGKEGALEEHLMGERWFDVANNPTATFVITSVAPRADSGTTHVYDVKGDLTMKGQTHEVAFPAAIYQDENGQVHASAKFEMDRTKWGITASSASFFDNLADNAVSDMVALSFSLVAAPAAQ